MGKKQRPKQVKDITQRHIAPQSNAKVTVQYIQPQRRMQPQEDEPTADELEEEVENIEYLDETANGGEEFITADHPLVVKDEATEEEDVFYPNAIHCLLDLYKEKYKKVIDQDTSMKGVACRVWRDIAKEMQERYFEFEAEQIRQKYASLRQQYLDIRTQEDVENFEYFEEIDSIYKDPSNSLIAQGGVAKKITTRDGMYKDEHLMKAELYEDIHQESSFAEFGSEEIVHKEHEFIDMVEKEIQAMGGGMQQSHDEASENNVSEVNMKIETPDKPVKTKSENPNRGTQNPHLKRQLNEAESDLDEPTKQMPKPSEDIPHVSRSSLQPPPVIGNQQPELTPDPSYEEVMSLRQLNAEQERRHHEQMSLLNKQFQQHQNTLEHLSSQIQELIKRLPPAL